MSIEKKYTPEEIKAFVDEAIRNRKANAELSLEELNSVNGGKWDMSIPEAAKFAREIEAQFGSDAAIEFLHDYNYPIPSGTSLDVCIEEMLRKNRNAYGGVLSGL